jgi:hypothetical protein
MGASHTRPAMAHRTAGEGATIPGVGTLSSKCSNSAVHTCTGQAPNVDNEPVSSSGLCQRAEIPSSASAMLNASSGYR